MWIKKVLKYLKGTRCPLCSCIDCNCGENEITGRSRKIECSTCKCAKECKKEECQCG